MNVGRRELSPRIWQTQLDDLVRGRLSAGTRPTRRRRRLHWQRLPRGQHHRHRAISCDRSDLNVKVGILSRSDLCGGRRFRHAGGAGGAGEEVLDPSGVVYDSVIRQPVAGAVVEFGRVIAGTFTALP